MAENTKNYLKIYFWQGMSILLRFLSMMIVVPYLTSNKEIYGIYAICLSVLIFLNYADLGFLNSCKKYAIECYARKDRTGEMQFIGFGVFILAFFCLFIFLTFWVLSFNPSLLIKDIQEGLQTDTASYLLSILALSVPVIVLQRMISIIFDIRLKGFINKRINIITSIIQIFSVHFFFRNDQYNIVGYFLFGQSLRLVDVIGAAIIAKAKFKYQYRELLKCIKFKKEVFKKSKSLAFAGLFALLLWVVFYEFDTLAIGKFIGAEAVAIFSIAATLPKITRSVFGIIYNPFTTRLNYFVGHNDERGLILYTKKLLALTASVTLFPCIAFSLISKPMILCWVGDQYIDSIRLAQITALQFSLSFISYIIGAFLTSKEKIRDIFFSSTISPIIYWGGVILTYKHWGLISFPVFKLTAMVVSSVYFLFLSHKHKIISIRFVLYDLIKPLLLPLSFLIISITFVHNFLPEEKSKINLIIVFAVTGLIILTSYIIQYFTSKTIKQTVSMVLNDLKSNKK